MPHETGAPTPHGGIGLSSTGVLLGLGASWALFRSMVALYPGTLPRVDGGRRHSCAVLLFAVAWRPGVRRFSVCCRRCWLRAAPELWACGPAEEAVLPADGRWREALIVLQVATTSTLLLARVVGEKLRHPARRSIRVSSMTICLRRKCRCRRTVQTDDDRIRSRDCGWRD